VVGEWDAYFGNVDDGLMAEDTFNNEM